MSRVARDPAPVAPPRPCTFTPSAALGALWTRVSQRELWSSCAGGWAAGLGLGLEVAPGGDLLWACRGLGSLNAYVVDLGHVVATRRNSTIQTKICRAPATPA